MKKSYVNRVLKNTFNSIHVIRNHTFISIFTFVILVSWFVLCYASPELTQIVLDAHEKDRPIPLLSHIYPHLDVETAYRIQKAYVQHRLKSDNVAGFKAGLTSESSQKKFNIDSPAIGVLFTSGKDTGNAFIDKSMFKTLMIETEIGFVIGQPIMHPLKDVSELRQRIRSIVPVIELPDLDFEDMKNVKGVDIIASNIAFSRFIVGHEKNIRGFDPNTVFVTLMRNGTTVNTGKSCDVFGDQWEAALWLVNTVVQQGWDIEPGHIIITGALGNMIDGKTGNYEADFGNLGEISFSIK